jgi:hypothetical protein
VENCTFEEYQMSAGERLGSVDKLATNTALSNNKLKSSADDRGTYTQHIISKIYSPSLQQCCQLVSQPLYYISLTFNIQYKQKARLDTLENNNWVSAQNIRDFSVLPLLAVCIYILSTNQAMNKPRLAIFNKLIPQMHFHRVPKMTRISS